MAASPFALGQFFRPASLFAAPIRLLEVALTRRRVMSELGALDDRMLRDIGLSRFDVASAMSEPLFRDPTVQLVHRAAETRAAAKASTQERLAFAGLLGAASCAKN